MLTISTSLKYINGTLGFGGSGVTNRMSMIWSKKWYSTGIFRWSWSFKKNVIFDVILKCLGPPSEKMCEWEQPLNKLHHNPFPNTHNKSNVIFHWGWMCIKMMIGSTKSIFRCRIMGIEANNQVLIKSPLNFYLSKIMD